MTMTLDWNSLRGRAAAEYGHSLLRQLREGHAYRQLSVRDGVQLKLASMFGAEYACEIADELAGDEVEAVVDGLRFVARWLPEGILQISLVAACAQCGRRMVSEPLLSLLDLGRELTRLEMTGSLGCHDCRELSANQD